MEAELWEEDQRACRKLNQPDLESTADWMLKQEWEATMGRVEAQ